jgi:hypothetical protein
MVRLPRLYLGTFKTLFISVLGAVLSNELEGELCPSRCFLSPHCSLSLLLRVLAAF